MRAFLDSIPGQSWSEMGSRIAFAVGVAVAYSSKHKKNSNGGNMTMQKNKRQILSRLWRFKASGPQRRDPLLV
jgi:hypothetical protein